MTTRDKFHRLRVRPFWFVIAAIAALLLTPVLWIGVPYYFQQQAIAAVEAAGGEVWIEARGPQWLRNLIGEEAMMGFDRVLAVNFYRVPEPELTLCERFPHLEILDLRRSGVRGADLKSVTLPEGVSSLLLSGTAVGDEGLEAITRSSHLQSVSLNATAVTDAGMPHLAKLLNLEEIDLRGTAVTPDGLLQLRSLPRLTHLIVQPATFQPGDLERLEAAMPGVKIADIDGS